MHRLLKRQITRHLEANHLNDEKIKSFLHVVEEAYQNFEQDHLHFERILELSSKESFRELTNLKNAINAASMVVITDYKGIIQFVNENFRNVSGYSTSEAVGKNHRVLNSGYHPSEFFSELWETITSGKIWTGEIKNKSKDGQFYWVNTTIVPLLNETGIPTQYIAIQHDITHVKNAELAIREYALDLEKKNKELDQFAYIVSHDLKAPLRAINNLSEWVEEDLGAEVSEDVKGNLSLLRGRVKRMEGLINGILEYSRAGRIKARVENVDVAELLTDMMQTLAVPLSFRVIIQQNLPVIKTERIAFEQVFSNLISNAIKYNNSNDPIIEIGYKNGNNFYEFFVADNGPGIEKEFFDKIFIIFQTLQSRDKIESTGVGLAIVKKIIDEKGGKVWVDSEKGFGAKFSFTWPV
jgi:PAS domain S-box-containing protein